MAFTKLFNTTALVSDALYICGQVGKIIHLCKKLQMHFLWALSFTKLSQLPILLPCITRVLLDTTVVPIVSEHLLRDHSHKRIFWVFIVSRSLLTLRSHKKHKTPSWHFNHGNKELLPLARGENRNSLWKSEVLKPVFLFVLPGTKKNLTRNKTYCHREYIHSFGNSLASLLQSPVGYSSPKAVFIGAVQFFCSLLVGKIVVADLDEKRLQQKYHFCVPPEFFFWTYHFFSGVICINCSLHAYICIKIINAIIHFHTSFKYTMFRLFNESWVFHIMIQQTYRRLESDSLQVKIHVTYYHYDHFP